MNMAAKNQMKIGIVILALAGTVLAQAQTVTDQHTPADPPTSTTANPPVTRGYADKTYVIGDDDLLGINVWKEPALTTSIPVRSDGKISLPLIGEVQASGKTPTQLKNDITTRLHTYLSAPDVTVTVLQMNSQKFNILGRVTKPGSYSLSESTTVLDAIAAAGGLQDFAKQKGIYILRKTLGGDAMRIPFNYKDVIRGERLEENIKLRPDDTIVVP
jgi:polysaccharide export outer membrane protein